MEKEFIIGIDGGGTATYIRACRTDGAFLGEWRAGALNINGQSYEMAVSTIKQVLGLVKDAGLPAEKCLGVCVGAAGISNADTAAVIRRALAEGGINGKIILVGDQETALAAAFEELWGVVLIAGTGSICYGKDKKGIAYRAGGYGHIIDDAGGAYAIGRDVLRAVVRGVDGRGNKTSLEKAVYRALGIRSPEELVGWLHAPERTKKEIAALAPLAGEEAAAGDEAAVRILEEAAKELASLADAVLSKVDGADRIALAGSVLLNNEEVCRMFTECLREMHPGVQPVKLLEKPVLGAVRIIRREL